MTVVINATKCSIDGATNTGRPLCEVDPSKIIGAIVLPANKMFTDTELGTLKVTLQNACLDVISKRIYPIFRFGEIADQSEDVTISTLGYGSKNISKEGKYDWIFKFVKSGLLFNNKLRKFNGTTNKTVIFIDDNNTLYGTLTANNDGDVCLAGLSLDFLYVKPFKIGDGSNPTIYEIRFGLSEPKQLNDDAAWVNADFNVETEIKGLIDVELYQIAVAAGVATVGIRTKGDKVDMFETYSTDLAVGSLWKVAKAGVDVVITSVEASSTVSGWDVTFTGTGAHTITLTTPALLAAADIGGAPENGYEADVLTVTMPT